MSRQETVQRIEEEKIVVITRGIYGDGLMKLADALFQGGIRCFGIMYSPSNPDMCTRMKENIQALHAQFGDELHLGIGTVLTEEQVHNAKGAGARLVVSPNFDEKIVKETLALNVVSMPDCMSPTGIVAADKASVGFVKLFPAGALGIKYCKNIYTPLHHVEYITTVGITGETLVQYLRLGFTGADINSQLADKKCHKEGNYAGLTCRAKHFVELVKQSWKRRKRKKDNMMKNLKLTRINFRLIHRQVMARWVARYEIESIVVIDDRSAKSLILKKIPLGAAPSGVKVLVWNVTEATEKWKAQEFPRSNLLILFKDTSQAKAA